MNQYKHNDQDYDNIKQVTDGATPEELFKKLGKLELQVAQLTKVVEFLERQDNRSRSSFEQISARIAARK
jgi:hypothetical protein